jgi:zinc D-Ala-D-Ala dipeptidase
MRRILIIAFTFFSLKCVALPPNFMYLKEVDPSILQEIRYAGAHNFVGRPIKGYEHSTCILTKEAAMALKHAQAELRTQRLSLKVYDCYRPTSAVADFLQWSKHPLDQKMKAEFYPSIAKGQLFALGYIAKYSGHSRGSTVDLTLVQRPSRVVDMGTSYDYLDPRSHINAIAISPNAKANRLLLRKIMIKNGFEPYEKEWWHFTLHNEPYKNSYFNFPVR